MAFVGIFVAIACIMANAGERPHVMHSPYDGFTRLYDAAYICQREHTLINPVQMNHICLIELGECGNVCTCVGNVYGKKIMLFKMVRFPDDDAFPNELPYFPP